ncbi:MAG: S-layer homology domain-containing protein, partial [Sulfobacillus sp.]
ALGTAAAAAAASYMTTATTFTDNSSIPSWARGYVVEAVKVGLVKGYPDGSFQPNNSVSSADDPFFVSQFSTAFASFSGAASTLTVSASTTDAAVGQQVVLTSTIKDAAGNTVTGGTVTYSVNSTNAVLSGNTFVGSQAGNYVVTATSGTLTGTVDIAVFGAAAMLKIVTPATVVANGVASNTVKVEVVDANGNVVANDNTDTVDLSSSNTSVLAAPSPGAAQTVNGVATFTLTSGNVALGTTTLTATMPSTSTNYTVINGNGPYTATVTSVAQTATAVSLSAQTFVSNNTAGSYAVTAFVNDQSGNPMLNGAFGINFTVTGAGATFSNGATSETLYYEGSINSVNGLTATVDVPAAAVGTITVTGTSATTGISSGTVSTTAGETGAAVGLQMTQSTTTVNADTLAASTNSATAAADVLSITPVDANGHPTNFTGTVTVAETSGGLTATNVAMNGSTTGSVSVSFSAASSGSVNLYNNNASAVGTYDFQASAVGLTSSPQVALVVTPGAANGVSISAPAASPVYVGYANPTAAITAQLTDAEGNNVNLAGQTVSFATSNTSASSMSVASAATNASGQSSSTLTLDPTLGSGSSVTVTVTSTFFVNGANSTKTANQVVYLEPTVPTSLTASFSSTAPQAGTTVTLNIYGTDQYGNPSGYGTSFMVTPSAGLTLPGSCTASDVCTATVAGTGHWQISGIGVSTAGTQSVTVQDLSSTSNLTAGASLSVVPAGFTQFIVVNSSSQPLAANSTNFNTGFTANSGTTVFLWGADSSNNLAPDGVAATVYVWSNASSFTFTGGGAVAHGTVGAGTDPSGIYYAISVPANSGPIQLTYTNTTSATTAQYDNLMASTTAP